MAGKSTVGKCSTQLADPQVEARVTELETRMAFQEQSLQELSDALAQSRQEIRRGSALLHRVLAELAHIRAPMDANPGDETPPHY